MYTFMAIAGGVALILFGVRYLRKGLDRLFGPKLGPWMQRLAGSRIRALLTGIGVTVLAPSSTTMSVLAVQTVQAGHLTPRRMLAIMLGANIGLTILVQLVALPLDRIAPALLAVGFVLFQYIAGNRKRGVGQIILAFGFIFLGVLTIKGAFPAASSTGHSDLQELIAIAERHPLFMVLLSAVLATALQSSTAVILLMISLGASEQIDVPMSAALAWVAGANVGLGFTPLILGWSQVQSRRLAIGNLLLKLVMAGLTLALLPQLADMMARTWPPFAFQVANFHSLFNIVLAAVGLPLVEQVSLLVEWIVPEPRKTSEQERFGPRHISTVTSDSVALALGASMREILHVSEIVRAMLSDLWQALKSDDAALAARVGERDDQVDLLDDQIKKFLTRLGNLDSDPDSAAEQMRQLRYLTELETVGDIIDKNLSELVEKKVREKVDFSEEGWRELDDFHAKVMENMLIADTAFARQDKMLAQQLLRHKDRINAYEHELRDRHFARLKQSRMLSHESSAVHLDILTHLKRINSCVSHVAYAMLQNGRSS